MDIKGVLEAARSSKLVSPSLSLASKLGLAFIVFPSTCNFDQEVGIGEGNPRSKYGKIDLTSEYVYKHGH